MDKRVLVDIYDFWFGAEGSADELDGARVDFWMHQDDETDREVRQRFGHLIGCASAIEWDADRLTRKEALALVVLFDQFPRNICRTTGQAYAYDHIARRLARRLTADGWQCFTAMERFLLGLPFVHHEDMADQDYAVMLAAEAVVRASHQQQEAYRFCLDQAIRHRDLIRRFGRFPHRNRALGRVSTEEEIAFMRENGRGF